MSDGMVCILSVVFRSRTWLEHWDIAGRVEHVESDANISDGGSRVGVDDRMAALLGFELFQEQMPAHWPLRRTLAGLQDCFSVFENMCVYSSVAWVRW